MFCTHALSNGSIVQWCTAPRKAERRKLTSIDIIRRLLQSLFFFWWNKIAVALLAIQGTRILVSCSSDARGTFWIMWLSLACSVPLLPSPLPSCFLFAFRNMFFKFHKTSRVEVMCLHYLVFMMVLIHKHFLWTSRALHLIPVPSEVQCGC